MKYTITHVIKSVVLLLALTVNGCNQKTDDKDEKSVAQENFVIGWLHGNCLAIKYEIDLKSNHLIVIDLDTNIISTPVIGKAAKSGDECYALLEDRVSINLQDGRRFYTVISKEPINLGIAVIYNEDRAQKQRRSQALDLNNDGVKETFSSCSTSEGMEFSVWSARPYKSELIWSDYYYLGYDTEANCPTNE